jgi:hypothetical protein
MTTATKKPTTWDEAFCKAQSEFPEIPKDCEVDTGKFKYTYASLPAILRLVLPVLHKHGLFLTQLFYADGSLGTIISHTSGQQVVSTMPMPTSLQMKAQDYGKQITYMRRYALITMLGIAPDDDVDAQDVPTPDPLPPPPPELDTITEPPRAVVARLLTDDKDLIKAWHLEPLTERSAPRVVSDLVEIVMSEVMPDGWDENVDLYQAARRKMNSVIDSRIAEE